MSTRVLTTSLREDGWTVFIFKHSWEDTMIIDGEAKDAIDGKQCLSRNRLFGGLVTQ